MGNSAAMTASQAQSMQEASMGASAITSLAGGFQNAAALKAQGSYASTIANTNAAMANLKATQTEQAGDIAASRKQLQTQGEVGTARASAGASGVDVNVGSPAQVQAGINVAGGTDVNTIRMNAARAAWGYRTTAMQDTYQAQFEQITSKQRQIQSLATGGLQAVSAPLSMYSQAALWRLRYGGKGNSGVPYPSDGDFWGAS